jgi:hypothetical protein
VDEVAEESVYGPVLLAGILQTIDATKLSGSDDTDSIQFAAPAVPAGITEEHERKVQQASQVLVQDSTQAAYVFLKTHSESSEQSPVSAAQVV